MTFLHNHRDVIAAMDFFTVPTVTFRVLYGFFVIHHARRQVAASMALDLRPGVEAEAALGHTERLHPRPVAATARTVRRAFALAFGTRASDAERLQDQLKSRVSRALSGVSPG